MKKLLLASVISLACVGGAWANSGSGAQSSAAGSSAVIGGPNSLGVAGGFANVTSTSSSASTLTPIPASSASTATHLNTFSGTLNLGPAAGTAANAAQGSSFAWSHIP